MELHTCLEVDHIRLHISITIDISFRAINKPASSEILVCWNTKLAVLPPPPHFQQWSMSFITFPTIFRRVKTYFSTRRGYIQIAGLCRAIIYFAQNSTTAPNKLDRTKMRGRFIMRHRRLYRLCYCQAENHWSKQSKGKEILFSVDIT